MAEVNPGDECRIWLNERLIYDSTTGKSVREVIDAVNKLEGSIIGIGVLVDRSEQSPDFGYPLFSCHRSITQTYPLDDCPLCAARVPLVKPGTG